MKRLLFVHMLCVETIIFRVRCLIASNRFHLSNGYLSVCAYLSVRFFFLVAVNEICSKNSYRVPLFFFSFNPNTEQIEHEPKPIPLTIEPNNTNNQFFRLYWSWHLSSAVFSDWLQFLYMNDMRFNWISVVRNEHWLKYH